MSSGRTDVVREAGLLEHYHITRHYLGFDSCVVTAADYKVDDGGALNKSRLFPALQQVIQKHGALGVRLDESSSDHPLFLRLPKFTFSDVVQYLDGQAEDGTLTSVMEKQLATRFDTKAPVPLWRLIIFHETTVIFAWHHCIGDGISGFNFHTSLLDALNRPTAILSTDQTQLVVPESPSLGPCLEHTVSLTPGMVTMCRSIFQTFAPPSWTHNGHSWTGNTVPKHPTLRTHVRLIALSKHDSKDLISICRAHHATLTSMLHATAVSILSKLIQEQETKSNYKDMETSVPVSMRGIGNIPADIMGDFVSTIHAHLAIDPSFSWQKAAEFSALIRQKKQSSFEEVGMLRFLLGQYESFFKGKLGKKRGGAFEISNLGNFDVRREESSDKWEIQRAYFVQCDSALGSALKLNVVGTSTGGVTITISWGEEALERSFADEFAQNFEVCILKIIREEANQ